MTSSPHASATLAGRTALVTGAASGIGQAVAQRFVELGAHVVLVDRDDEAMGKVAAEIAAAETLGGTVETQVIDLADPDLPAVIAGSGLASRSIDLLINNAGIQHVAAIEDFDPVTFARIHAIMLQAPFLLAQAVLPGMYERGWGRLVHISSVHGHRASAFKSAYVSAKHGLEGLSKVIALEAAGRGVTSNTVCPGYVRTPLVEDQISAQARSHNIDEQAVLGDVLLARQPVKRLVEPSEVADLVGFLCGPGTDSITGTSYLMDGGWSAQ